MDVREFLLIASVTFFEAQVLITFRNFLFILTDDQDITLNSLSVMPKLQSLVIGSQLLAMVANLVEVSFSIDSIWA